MELKLNLPSFPNLPTDNANTIYYKLEVVDERKLNWIVQTNPPTENYYKMLNQIYFKKLYATKR